MTSSTRLAFPRKRSSAVLLGSFFLLLTAVVLGSWIFVAPDFREQLAQRRTGSGTVVLDRHGNVLRIFPDEKGCFGLWVHHAAVPQILVDAVTAAEDKRFFRHPGFDPIAIARALYVNLNGADKRSGASTITQQVVRLLHSRPRTYVAKCVELVESFAMELQLSKNEILELYVNLAPMGGNIRGAALASRAYFGKNLDQIGLCEAAALAALPRSPSRFNPATAGAMHRLMAEKDRVLGRMCRLGIISKDQYSMNRGNTVSIARRKLPFEAPHFVESVAAMRQVRGGRIETSLDLDIQHGIERILRSHADRLRAYGIRQAATIVASTKESAVLAMAGSLGYSSTDLGFNNGSMSPRSAGSTLKPFLYALALEQGHQASTQIPDTFRSYTTPRGDYLPLNADRRLYGPVVMRSALGNSLNIPAVKMLREVGLDPFCRILSDAGLVDAPGTAGEHYGLGLAIGNLEVSLYNLVQAYGTLAGGGDFRPLTMMKQPRPHVLKKIFSKETAYIITDILADPTARMITFGNPGYFRFGFPVALKTGTSTNFRDSWIVAYTSEHVVGIWAGNFDGRSIGFSSGAGACGPILHDIVRFLYAHGPSPGYQRPARVKELRVCSMSGMPASALCPYTSRELVVTGKEAPLCDMDHERDHHVLTPDYAAWLAHREARQGKGRFRLSTETVQSDAGRVDHVAGPIEIISPHDEDHFVLSPHRNNVIRFQVRTHRLVKHVAWFVDGMEIFRAGPPYEFFWSPLKGKHVVLAVTPSDEAARVEIIVE